MSSGSHVDRDRPCGSHSDHVPHPWDKGRRRCPGHGKYAADRPPVLAGTEEPCPGRYVGPTGVVWVCIAPLHATYPGGYAGTGHSMRAVHPAQ